MKTFAKTFETHPILRKLPFLGTLFVFLIVTFACNLSRLNSKTASMVSPEPVPEENFCAEEVPSVFAAYANERGLHPDEISHLFELVLKYINPVDTVTGFATGMNRLPVLLRVSIASKKGERKFYYIEIDVRNLGGLNAALGTHSEANRIFRRMAKVVQTHLQKLIENEHDLCSFRHGGDEFSFVLNPTKLPKSPQVSSNALAEITEQLKKAQEEIAKFVKAWKTADGVTIDLSAIIHPKKCLSEKLMRDLNFSVAQELAEAALCTPHLGTGIYFGISEVLPLDNSDLAKSDPYTWLARNVIQAADQAMSDQKKFSGVTEPPDFDEGLAPNLVARPLLNCQAAAWFCIVEGQHGIDWSRFSEVSRAKDTHQG